MWKALAANKADQVDAAKDVIAEVKQERDDLVQRLAVMEMAMRDNTLGLDLQMANQKLAAKVSELDNIKGGEFERRVQKVADVWSGKCKRLEDELASKAFLANGTRFKVAQLASGCAVFGLPEELAGKWVALVAADNDCHLKQGVSDEEMK